VGAFVGAAVVLVLELLVLVLELLVLVLELVLELLVLVVGRQQHSASVIRQPIGHALQISHILRRHKCDHL